MSFLQAEDGIRVYKVTGVQTCALPIYSLQLGNLTEEVLQGRSSCIGTECVEEGTASGRGRLVVTGVGEIGRASCRERVEVGGDGATVMDKHVASGVWCIASKTTQVCVP